MRSTFAFTLIFISCITFAQEPSSELSKLFEEAEEIYKKYRIENPLWRGQHPEKFQYQQVDQEVERNEKLKIVLTKLKRLAPESLSEQEVINRSIRIMQLENEIAYTDYKIYYMPFNAEGGFFNRPLFFLNNLPFETQQDFQDYIGWLPSFAEYLDHNVNLMKEGMDDGIVPPKIIVQNLSKLIEPWCSEDLLRHPMYKPFVGIENKLAKKEGEAVIKSANEVFKKQIIPSYKKTQKFFQEEYIKAANEKVGISEIKGGKEYYENRIKHFTTLEMTPDSVYNLGMQEVNRIKAEMDKIIEDLGFEGSFADFLKFLRTDPQFFASTPQELLNKAAWLSKKAEGALPPLFGELYELPFTVAPVPDEIAPNYTGGRYVGGSREQNKPGTYWVNTYDLKSRTLYTLPALTLHEAVPGHHLQITLAAEMEKKDIPDFRNSYYISAFGEGWGLYAEFLGEEMGIYETPYDLFGRYTYEMWRACRLVVDVGLHYKGWTREEAVQFMSENTALSLHEVNTEIDRYIGWPGQAVSYKIGELKIRELRKNAEKELGESFNIQKFHQIILKNGAVPLPILENQVSNYIIQAKQ